MMTWDEITPLAGYFSQMRAGVLRGYERGRSVIRVEAELRLDPDRMLPHYAGRASQIAEMMRQVSIVRAELQISGAANYLPQNPTAFCAGFDTCRAGGAVPASTVAFTLAVGRRLGFQAEATASEQF